MRTPGIALDKARHVRNVPIQILLLIAQRIDVACQISFFVALEDAGGYHFQSTAGGGCGSNNLGWTSGCLASGGTTTVLVGNNGTVLAGDRNGSTSRQYCRTLLLPILQLVILPPFHLLRMLPLPRRRPTPITNPSNMILRPLLDQTNPLQHVGDIVNPPFLHLQLPRRRVQIQSPDLVGGSGLETDARAILEVGVGRCAF
mmetsp:Transcript_26662/g.57333  ORF Transcript_26662/g.57333 Transcript_26662/m.57333 type:complete len:201 (-) Transcript_26662:510-1112(-)